jgi:hypothetical protein
MRLLRRLAGRYRILMGYCPSCNSDAPRIDNCAVCRVGFRYSYEPGWKSRMLGFDAEELWERYAERDYR